MRVLVTGATGLVGQRLVRRLLEENHEVVVLSRNVIRAELTLPVRCEVHEWNPTQGRVDRDAFDEIDAVIHLAGEGVADSRWSDTRKAQILASRVDSSHVLLGILEGIPEGQRPHTFISASAVGYYGDRYDEVLDEDSDVGIGFLSEVCWAWEDQIARAEQLGIRTVGMRTGIVLAKEGGALARMLPPFRLGVGGKLGGGRQWMSWIHIDDLVSMYLFALQNKDVGGALNAVAPKPVTNREFTRGLGRALRRPTFLPVPAFALRAVLGEMSSMLLGGQRVHCAEAQKLGFQFDYPELSTALGDLCSDFSTEMDSEIWLDRTCEEVFPFFSDARNLEMLTPQFLKFQVKRVSTGEIDEGTLIDYQLRLRGIPMRWRSRIDLWHPPRLFVDSQIKGPYKSWHHKHEFEDFDGGTIVKDKVRYELPGGVLGQLVAGWLIRRDLNKVFDYRRAMMFATFP